MNDAYRLLCTAYGAPPEIRAEPLGAPPAPGPGQVLIGIERAALNFTDHLMVQGRYQDRPDPPFVPGLDGGGLVLAAGPGVTGFAVGDRVVSSGVAGAWAAWLLAPADRLVKVPDGLAVADAVASINSHLTAYHGLVDRAGMRAGDRVLVLGANGAVGKAAAQLARHLGAQVYTVARAGKALRIGGEGQDTICAPDELKDRLKQLLGRRGADIVVDPVGDSYTEAAVRNLAWRGRLLVIGFAAGEIPRIPTNLLLLKGAAIVGTYCGGLLIHDLAAFNEQLAATFALMNSGVLTSAPHETLPARGFSAIWRRFDTAPRGTKILLGFGA